MTEALRIPPHSEEAERGVLGSILLAPIESMRKCLRADLVSDAFYDRRHQTLFAELSAMYQQNSRSMDAITIAEWLKTHSVLENVGGYDYLVVPSSLLTLFTMRPSSKLLI